ncbi:MAG: YbaL family putative K(+) efflux transporter [Pseudomonadota bacterium]
MQDYPLLGILSIGFVLAFALGLLAQRLRVSPLVGYLLAGVMIGPHTPGYVGDPGLSYELAEIGVILLMFGVGLHFSVRDLLEVRRIAVTGATLQIATATLLGLGLALLMGWSVGAGLIFGLALSVASTVVLLRALEERGMVETRRGRIAVGWLVVEDLVMVLALVLIPAVMEALAPAAGGAATAGPAAIAGTIALTIGKVLAFAALALLVGRKAIPRLLHVVAGTGSPELFRLAILAIALGVAFGAAKLFGVSFALGAFFAGMMLNESPLGHRAAVESLPLRDAFAVLFFVSVGMLFDWTIVLREPWALAGTLFIILVGKSVAAYWLVRWLRHDRGTAATVSASLAQIGEFSFILAGLGVSLALLPPEGRDLILGGALLSILLNPAVFRLAARFEAMGDGIAAAGGDLYRPPPSRPTHVLVVGYGRVGRACALDLKRTGTRIVVIEQEADAAEAARRDGMDQVVRAHATSAVQLDADLLGLASAVCLAIPDPFVSGTVAEQARRERAGLPIVARAHAEAEREHLRRHGASHVIVGELEIARGMVAFVERG